MIKISRLGGDGTGADVTEIAPEVLAAISASIGIVLEGDDVALLAAVMAVIVHQSSRKVPVLNVRHRTRNWALSGRQKLMDCRQW